MRSVSDEYMNDTSDRGMARIAFEYADYAMDSYSNFGVGVSMLVDFASRDRDYQSSPSEMYEDSSRYRQTYAGCNINISGMEVKIHAEQMALFQALLDIQKYGAIESSSIKKVVVATTENDGSLVCGHCLQVIRGACDYIGCDPSRVDYTAVVVDENDEPDEGEADIEYTYYRHTLDELLGDTYVSE